jgi:hypothetical protein
MMGSERVELLNGERKEDPSKQPGREGEQSKKLWRGKNWSSIGSLFGAPLETENRASSTWDIPGIGRRPLIAKPPDSQMSRLPYLHVTYDWVVMRRLGKFVTAWPSASRGTSGRRLQAGCLDSVEKDV